MDTAYLGEVRLFCGSTPPPGWLFCDGRALDVDQYVHLHAVIGDTFGGDGATFNLPDLRGRVPVHRTDAMPQGHAGGAERVNLGEQHVGTHNHTFSATTKLANAPSPAGNAPAQSPAVQVWIADNPATTLLALSPPALTKTTNGGQAHENMPPFVTVNYMIAFEGRVGGDGDE